MEFTVSLKLKITEEDILDIYDTAGYGIAYWANEAEIDEPSCTYTVTYEDYPSNEIQSKTIGPRDIMNGIAKMLEQGYNSNIVYEGTIDTGEIDSYAADIIVQYAIFGEIIFG